MEVEESVSPVPVSAKSLHGTAQTPCVERPSVRRPCSVKIEKTFLEKGGVVFYEVCMSGFSDLTARSDGERISPGATQGCVEMRDVGAEATVKDGSSEEAELECCVTIRRRYKHFKTFHRRLQVLANACKRKNKEGEIATEPYCQDGQICEPQLIKREQLPRLPPLRLKIFVDHSSSNFVSDRSRALELYLHAILSDPELRRLLISSTELRRWITDLPQPYYILSKGNMDCPSLYRSWDIFNPQAVQAWTISECRPEFPDDAQQSTSSGSFWSDGGAIRELEENIGPEDSASINSLHPCRGVDLSLNARFGLFHGNLWQLAVDGIGMDAPGDYKATSNSSFAETMRVAGSRARRELKSLDECRIGDVSVLPCSHGLNLPTRYILMTGSAYYVREHESASFSGLHLCYIKLLEAAVDYGCRTIALDCMFSQDKGFPKERAAQVAVRTVRHFLNCYGNEIERVIIVSRTSADHQALEHAASVCLPRTEEIDMQESLRSDVWADCNLDKKGDYVIEERGFRIGESPLDVPWR